MTIESDTPIIPAIVAEAVMYEVEVHCPVHTDLTIEQTDETIQELADKAEAIYSANPNFRRKVKSAGGRNYLYGFMRHWYAAWLKDHRHECFKALPADFCLGAAW